MSITSGLHTFGEVISASDFDFSRTEGDHRRVIVAKLGMDSLDDKFRIMPGTPAINIEFDGEVVATVDVVDPPSDE